MYIKFTTKFNNDWGRGDRDHMGILWKYHETN